MFIPAVHPLSRVKWKQDHQNIDYSVQVLCFLSNFQQSAGSTLTHGTPGTHNRSSEALGQIRHIRNGWAAPQEQVLSSGCHRAMCSPLLSVFLSGYIHFDFYQDPQTRLLGDPQIPKPNNFTRSYFLVPVKTILCHSKPGWSAISWWYRGLQNRGSSNPQNWAEPRAQNFIPDVKREGNKSYHWHPGELPYVLLLTASTTTVDRLCLLLFPQCAVVTSHIYLILLPLGSYRHQAEASQGCLAHLTKNLLPNYTDRDRSWQIFTKSLMARVWIFYFFPLPSSN